jgi:hypothetical protein
MPEKLIDKQWIDIVMPPAPDHMLPWWLILTAVLTLSLVIVLWQFWRRRPRQHLRRVLKHLTQQLNSTTDYRHVLVQLERALCRFHRLPYLHATPLLHPRWQQLFVDITTQRYQKQQPDPLSTRLLIQQCRDVLAQSGASHAV